MKKKKRFHIYHFLKGHFDQVAYGINADGKHYADVIKDRKTYHLRGNLVKATIKCLRLG